MTWPASGLVGTDRVELIAITPLLVQAPGMPARPRKPPSEPRTVYLEGPGLVDYVNAMEWHQPPQRQRPIDRRQEGWHWQQQRFTLDTFDVYPIQSAADRPSRRPANQHGPEARVVEVTDIGSTTSDPAVIGWQMPVQGPRRDIQRRSSESPSLPTIDQPTMLLDPNQTAPGPGRQIQRRQLQEAFVIFDQAADTTRYLGVGIEVPTRPRRAPQMGDHRGIWFEALDLPAFRFLEVATIVPARRLPPTESTAGPANLVQPPNVLALQAPPANPRPSTIGIYRSVATEPPWGPDGQTIFIPAQESRPVRRIRHGEGVAWPSPQTTVIVIAGPYWVAAGDIYVSAAIAGDVQPQ